MKSTLSGTSDIGHFNPGPPWRRGFDRLKLIASCANCNMAGHAWGLIKRSSTWDDHSENPRKGWYFPLNGESSPIHLGARNIDQSPNCAVSNFAPEKIEAPTGQIAHDPVSITRHVIQKYEYQTNWGERRVSEI